MGGGGKKTMSSIGGVRSKSAMAHCNVLYIYEYLHIIIQITFHK